MTGYSRSGRHASLPSLTQSDYPQVGSAAVTKEEPSKMGLQTRAVGWMELSEKDLRPGFPVPNLGHCGNHPHQGSPAEGPGLAQ
jgi:hypothetical protein